MLPDGTRWRRESGESRGKNGYSFRWTKVAGVSPAGQVGRTRRRPLHRSDAPAWLRLWAGAGGVGGAMVAGQRLGRHEGAGGGEERVQGRRRCLARDLARGHRL